MSATANTGRLYGVGLGPGDPELLTVKAVRLIDVTPVIAYFAKSGRRGNARAIVDRWMPASAQELPLYYPVTTEIPLSDPTYKAQLTAFYETSSDAIAAHLSAGRDVAVLSEGDPLFYGSFMHLYVRLKGRFQTTIVPGVTGMAGCWSAAGEPITWGDNVLTVLPGTMEQSAMIARLQATDAAVIMKVGRNFGKIRAALVAAGLYDRAIYVERGTMSGEKVMRLADKSDDVAPYFAIVLVSGQGRRP
jgi:precorrin-2/cobalt-factor-2 C20-methyltransferase